MEGVQVPLSDCVYRRLLECQVEITDLFLKRFGCAVDILGPRFDTPRHVPSFPAEKVYEKRVLSYHVVSVWKDDLTRHNADVVVNAANEDLDHIGGLARALADAGGPDVVKDSRHHIKTQGKVRTGSYAVTRSGNLPCKALLHAVGPMWLSGIANICESELKQCIENVLTYISQCADAKSVAIPAVSSGIFGFPLHLCAKVIVDTVKSFCYNATSPPKEIRLVNFDDPTVQAMKAACEGILGPSDYIMGAKSASPNPAMVQTRSQANMGLTPPPRHDIPQTITISGLKLHLKTGLIQEQRTDVIVNSVGSDLDLSHGEISKAILNKAGYQIQDEINRYKPKDSYTTMIPTSGYFLPCNWVYHTIMKYKSPMGLAQVVSECLVMAHHHKSSSISFPALGTGINRIDKGTAAKAMTQAVVTFAREYNASMDVYFVIYRKDQDIYQAFQKELSVYGQDMKMEISTESRGHTSDVFPAKSEETCLRISGPNPEGVAEAQAWLKRMFNKESITIQNNHILLLGSEEHKALSSLRVTEVSIQEDLSNACSALTIKGPPEEKLCAAILVEQLLLGVQEEQAEELEEDLVEAAVRWLYQNDRGTHRYPAKANRELERAFMTKRSKITLTSEPHHQIDMRNGLASGKDGEYQIKRRPISDLPDDSKNMLSPDCWLSRTVEVDSYSDQFKKCSNELQKHHLKLVKMEKIQNQYLSAIFKSKKESIQKEIKSLYQVVPRQFTKLVCDVGFQSLYTYPKEMKFGDGIYFNGALRKIPESFQSCDADGLLRIFLAEVLVDNFAQGRSEAPPLQQIWDSSKTASILDLYDCRVNHCIAPDIFVILDSFRANPKYLLTCQPMHSSRV